MTPLEPAELSAYLDGELSEARTKEVSAMIAASPALLSELDALERRDIAWRQAARSAAFRPAAALATQGRAAVSGAVILGIVGLMIALIAMARMLDSFAFAIAVNLVAAALVSLGVFFVARAELAMVPEHGGVTG